MENKERLDTVLVKQGYAASREKAKEMLSEHHVTVNGRLAEKPSFRVGESDVICCDAPAEKYVGRGGYKLEKALRSADSSPQGCCCMDIGASTGGFTDCLLQNGASHVYSVDVGHGQMHEKLRKDPRVSVLEGTDIRSDALKQIVDRESVDFATVDVSFIPLERVLPSLLHFLRDEAVLVCLIKPQFEAGRAAIGKNGVVKDQRAHRQVLQAQRELFEELGLRLLGLTFSPITGGEGNIEYLAVLEKSGKGKDRIPDIPLLVREAFESLRGETGK